MSGSRQVLELLACDQCHKAYTRKDTLKRHKEGTHENRRVECPFCGEQLARRDGLLGHIRRYHSDQDPPPPSRRPPCNRPHGKANKRKGRETYLGESPDCFGETRASSASPQHPPSQLEYSDLGAADSGQLVAHMGGSFPHYSPHASPRGLQGAVGGAPPLLLTPPRLSPMVSPGLSPGLSPTVSPELSPVLSGPANVRLLPAEPFSTENANGLVPPFITLSRFEGSSGGSGPTFAAPGSTQLGFDDSCIDPQLLRFGSSGPWPFAINAGDDFSSDLNLGSFNS